MMCGNAGNFGGVWICELLAGTIVGEDGYGCEEERSTVEGVLVGDVCGRVGAIICPLVCEGEMFSDVSDETLAMALSMISCMSSSVSLSRTNTLQNWLAVKSYVPCNRER